VPRAAGSAAFLLRLDDLHDQLQVLIDPGGTGITMLERQTPVGQVTLGGQLVETLAADLQRDLGVTGITLVTFGPGISMR